MRDELLDLVHERRERLLHRVGKVVVGLLARGLCRLPLGRELLALRLDIGERSLRTIPILRLRLGERVLHFRQQLLGEIDRLRRVIARVLRVIDKVLQLIDIALMRVIERLRLVDLGLHLLGKLLRPISNLANLLFHCGERARKRGVAAAARLINHRLDLIDCALQHVLYVLRQIRISLLGRSIASLRFRLALIKRRLRSLAIAFRTSIVVLLGLIERRLALSEQVLRLIICLDAVVLRLLRVLDELLNLIEIALILIVLTLGLIERALSLLRELLRLGNRRANAFLDLSQQLPERGVVAAAGLRHQLLELGHDRLDRVLHVLRNIGNRLLGRGIAGLGFGLRRLVRALGLIRVALRTVVIVRLIELLERALDRIDRILRRVPRLLTVILGRERVGHELLNLIEITLVLIVFALGLLERALRLGHQLLCFRDGRANALLNLRKQLGERRIIRAANLADHVLNLVRERLQDVLDVLRHIRDRLLNRRVAGLGLGLCGLERGLRLLRIGLRAVVILRLIELLNRALDCIDGLLARGPSLLAVVLRRQRILDEVLNLIEIALELVVLRLRLVEGFLCLGGELLRLVDGLADALLNLREEPRER